MNRIVLGLSFAALMTAQSALAQTVIQVGITPVGQPASGLNQQTKAPEGFAVEIIQAIAADAGLKIEFQAMPFGDLQPALLDKKIDAIAGSYGITPERQKIVDFTHAYGSYQDVLVVQASNTKTYGSVADLKGMKIATSRGSSYVKPLEDAGAEISLSNVPPESLAKLEAGAVEGFIDNVLQVNFMLRSSGKTNLRTVPSYKPILVGYLAFAVRKGDADLLSKLDRSLSKLEASGVVDNIKKKWGLD